jgi:hypothetical protein
MIIGQLHADFFTWPLKNKRMLCALICLSSMLFSCLLAHSNTIAKEKEEAFNDFEQIFQLTIDLEALEQYYHINELPDRRPLVILQNKITANKPRLIKFGVPVKYANLTKNEKGRLPYLEFTKVDIHTYTAKVDFIYPVEGIAGTVNFRKKEGLWKVEKFRLVER